MALLSQTEQPTVREGERMSFENYRWLVSGPL